MFEKTVPESEDARRYAFQIHELDQDNKLNAGELFNFFKWAYIFKQMTTENVHLLFQRNLDFHLQSQFGQFDIGIFKEEEYRYREMEDWLVKSNAQEVGLNYIQFSSWFQSSAHFIGQG